MQAGTLASNDVVALTSRVLVNGVPRAHESWSVGRDIVGDLPEQVVAGGGISQATGSITWAEQPDTTDTAANPWNASAGWLPGPGDTVVIYVGDGVAEWVQFTGLIDVTSGDVGAASLSTIVDRYDQLNKRFSHPPLLRIMPPLTQGAAKYRGAGLTAMHIADQALRNAGFYVTPRVESYPALSVPAQTSMWPDRDNLGTMVLGASYDGIFSQASNYSSPWGWSVGNFNCSYTPRLGNAPSVPVQMTVMVAPDHAGSMAFDVYYGTTRLRLWISTGRTAIALLNTGSGEVELGRVPMGAGTIVTLLMKSGTWTLRTNLGAQVNGSASLTGAAMDTVRLIGDENTRVAGFQVSHPETSGQEFASLSHIASAHVDSFELIGITDALPGVDGTSTSVLTEIGKATLTPFWIDELGVLQAIGSWDIRRRTPVQTVTTLNDICALSWSNSILAMRSVVSVDYQYPAITVSRWPNVTLYQGSGDTLESGQVTEGFIEPGSSEAWIQVDRALKTAGVDPAIFNAAWGSFDGGVYRDDEGGATTSAGAYVDSTLAVVKNSTYKLTTTVGTLPAGTKALLKTKDLPIYNPDMREFNLPIVRGYGRVEWADATLAAAVQGPGTAPALTHDAGPWSSRITDVVAVTKFADYIAAQVTTPAPVITGMEVIYDPRRQLGDVITISSPSLLGIELNALIVGVNNSTGDSFAQSLDVRIITAKSTYTTYAEYDKTISSGLTYAQWQALGPLPQTYVQFNTAK